MNLNSSTETKKEYPTKDKWWSTEIFQGHFDPVFSLGEEKNYIYIYIHIYIYIYSRFYTCRYIKKTSGVDEALQETN